MRGSRRGRGGQIVAPLASAIVLAFVSGCGLESFPYLYPPIARDVVDNDVSLPADSAAAFRHERANYDSGSFISLGYSLYYRIYLSRDKATTDRAAIEQLNTDEPTQVESRLRSQLRYLPFDTLDSFGAGTQTSDAPTIALNGVAEYSDSALSFNIVIPGYGLLVPASEVGVFRSTATGTDNPRLYRSSAASVADPTFSFFKLSIAAADPDGDVDATGYSSVNSDAYLQIVVLSYGVDSTTFTPMFSTAVLLRGDNDPFVLHSVTVSQ